MSSAAVENAANEQALFSLLPAPMHWAVVATVVAD